jgi:hypothetical protein
MKCQSLNVKLQNQLINTSKQAEFSKNSACWQRAKMVKWAIKIQISKPECQTTDAVIVLTFEI